MLACPGCKQNLGEDLCPQCNLYLLVEDPRPPWLPRLVVGDRVGRVWDVTIEVARGLKPAANLAGPIAHVEQPLRTALTDPLIDPSLPGPIHALLDALARVRDFIPTRDIALLNQAWVELGPAANALREACANAGIDVSGGDGQQPAWAASLQSAFIDTTDTVTFSEAEDEAEPSGLAAAFRLNLEQP